MSVPSVDAYTCLIDKDFKIPKAEESYHDVSYTAAYIPNSIDFIKRTRLKTSVTKTVLFYIFK